MNVKDFNAKIDRLVGSFLQPAGKPPEYIMMKLALDTKGMLIRRIQGSGKDSKGQSYTPYSKRYAEYRKAKGHQTSFKNFWFGGTMLSDIKPSPIRTDGAIVTVVLGPQKAIERKKMEKNSDYEESKGRDPLMTLSEQEIKVLERNFDKWLGQYLNTI